MIPTKQIDGDVSVTRHANIGGDAKVRGSVIVDHNLRVDGWLEAPNIKDAQKGLFCSEAQLKEAYPSPEAGWWALVGSDLPATVYVVEDGEWSVLKDASGYAVEGGTINADCSGYYKLLQELQDKLSSAPGLIESLDSEGSAEDILITFRKYNIADGIFSLPGFGAGLKLKGASETEAGLLTAEDYTKLVELGRSVSAVASQTKAAYDNSLKNAEAIEELREDLSMVADVDMPKIRYDIGKLPFVQLNGIVDTSSELESQACIDGTRDLWFARDTGGIHWIDSPGIVSGPLESVLSSTGAPVLTSRAVFMLDGDFYVLRDGDFFRLIDEGDVEKAKHATFIDQWNTAWGAYGKYDPVNAPDPQHPFMGNDIWMTYEEALEVDRYSRPVCGSWNSAYAIVPTKTLYPFATGGPLFTVADMAYAFYSAPNLEALTLLRAANPNSISYAFQQCAKLKSITGTIRMNSVPAVNVATFRNCAQLESISLSGLKCDISFIDSPLLSLASLQYMVANAANTAAITITVHPDVYAKLTDEANTDWHKVLTDAQSKNISFATTA